MLWTNVKRIIRSGFVNFVRNGFVSLAAVLIMTVTLFAIGSVVFIVVGLNSSLDEVKSKVDISVYFTISAEESDVLSLKKTLEALPSVVNVNYISKDQALENFRERHSSDSLTLQALDELGENPLGAVLNIQAKDPSQYEYIAAFLKGDAFSGGGASAIDRINYFDNKVAIEKLTKIIRAAEQLGFALSLILVLISIIIAFNTIRLAIFVSREEISVMRLVGASNKYIRGPFVISGILYGLVAGIITMAIFYPLTRWVGIYTSSFFGGVNFFIYFTKNFGQFFALIVGGGVFLGAVASYWAVRRYLKA